MPNWLPPPIRLDPGHAPTLTPACRGPLAAIVRPFYARRTPSLSCSMNLDAYLKRIGITARPPADLETLTLIMASHSRAIAFENCDIVLGKHISMSREDVEKKLVNAGRGGYCKLPFYSTHRWSFSLPPPTAAHRL